MNVWASIYPSVWLIAEMFIHLFTHTHIHLYEHSFNHSHVKTFICSLAHLFIHTYLQADEWTCISTLLQLKVRTDIQVYEWLVEPVNVCRLITRFIQSSVWPSLQMKRWLNENRLSAPRYSPIFRRLSPIFPNNNYFSELTITLHRYNIASRTCTSTADVTLFQTWKLGCIGRTGTGQSCFWSWCTNDVLILKDAISASLCIPFTYKLNVNIDIARYVYWHSQLMLCL